MIAYQNIASGIAPTVHFMYPLTVAITMMLFFKEKKSFSILFTVFVSLIGITLLSTDEVDFKDGDAITRLIAAATSILSYGGYIMGIWKSRAINIPSMALTCYVMGFGAPFYIISGYLTDGIRLVTNNHIWLNILKLAVPVTIASNISLVKTVERVSPTLILISGTLEPLTAVVIGCCVSKESPTWSSTIGITLIVTAVIIVTIHESNMGKVCR